jgi:heme-degrading monooxygenase HmoA
MFARHVSIQLKPNTLKDFTQTFENDVMPLLRRQPGFRDEVSLAAGDGMDVTAISFWDTKEQADAYATTAYPSVLKALDKFLDGPPRVRVMNVIHSTTHKLDSGAVLKAA